MGFEFLLLPNNYIFTVALITMAGIFALQAFSMLLGLGIDDAIDDLIDFDIDGDIDVDIDADIDFDTDIDIDHAVSGNLINNSLSWLGLGKVPFLIVLSSFLAAFGVAGIILQSTIMSVIGITLSGFIMAPIAFIAALPPTSIMTRMFGKMMPDVETSAIRIQDLAGSIAKVTNGTATHTRPTRAKVTDQHGTVHLVRIVSLNEGSTFTKGDEVILKEYNEDGIFRAANE